MVVAPTKHDHSLLKPGRPGESSRIYSSGTGGADIQAPGGGGGGDWYNNNIGGTGGSGGGCFWIPPDLSVKWYR